jgi:uncharacterized protein
VGLAVAVAAWGFMFAGPRRWFWPRAAAAGAAIGGFALVAHRSALGDALDAEPANFAAGVASAVAFYFVFRAGDAVLGRILPVLHAEVVDLYRVRAQAGTLTIPAVLVVVGPAEELFWRGFVQQEVGLAVAVAAYAAVHLWERKPVLVVAAVAGGLWWGALYDWTGSLTATIVSHLLWDLMMIVWFPLHTPAAAADPRRL